MSTLSPSEDMDALNTEVYGDRVGIVGIALPIGFYGKCPS